MRPEVLPLCKLDLIVPEVATQDAGENQTQKSYIALETMRNESASQDTPATAIMALVIVDQTSFLVGLKAYIAGGIHI